MPPTPKTIKAPLGTIMTASALSLRPPFLSELKNPGPQRAGCRPVLQMTQRLPGFKGEA